MQMDANLLMHRDPVCAGIREGRDVVVRVLDHQVTVERHVHGLPQRRDHRRPDGDIWHKVAVHDVDVQERGSAFDGLFGVRSEPRKVSREDGRRYLDHSEPRETGEI
jgi:hypothetical protein